MLLKLGTTYHMWNSFCYLHHHNLSAHLTAWTSYIFYDVFPLFSSYIYILPLSGAVAVTEHYPLMLPCPARGMSTVFFCFQAPWGEEMKGRRICLFFLFFFHFSAFRIFFILPQISQNTLKYKWQNPDYSDSLLSTNSMREKCAARVQILIRCASLLSKHSLV